MDQNKNVSDNAVFNGLLLLLVLVPLPLASNRTWAIAAITVYVVLLFCLGLRCWLKNWKWVSLRLFDFRVPIGLFLIFLMVSIFQVLPLPDSLVHILSPAAYDVQLQAGLQGGMHLTLDIYQSRLMLALTSSYFMVFLTCILAVRDAERLNILVSTLVWSGLFQALIGIFLFSIGAHYKIFFMEINHENVIGTFVNRNHFAGYLEMTLALGIGLMIVKLGNGSSNIYSGWKFKLIGALTFLMSPKMRLRLMLIVMVISLVLTRSRMGNSAFFASMLIVGLVAIILSRRNAPATATLIISLIIVDVFVIGTWVGLEKVVSRIHNTEIVMSNTEHAGEESIEERSLPAKYSIDLIKDFPLAGTGAGSFYNAFSCYRPPEITGYFDHAHNDYAEISADMGLIGAGVLFMFPIISLWVAFRTMYVRKSSLPRGVAFASAMGIVSIGIHSWVDFNLQIPANAMTFVVVVTLSWLAYKLPSQKYLINSA